MIRRAKRRPSQRRPTAIVVVLSLLASAAPAAAQEWTRFRGPNGSGISDATTVPAKWTEKDYNWKVKLPGVGHSSPVLWGRKIFLTCAGKRTGKRMVLCLAAADGRTIWQRDYPSRPHRKHNDNSFASSTPALDAEAVYVTWATPGKVTLLALDHAGRDRWRRDLGPFRSMHGSGNSPIVLDGLVVLGNDQKGKAFLIAVDRRTGKTRWRLERRSGLTPASTPCVLRAAGGEARVVFTTTAHGITAVDAKTGHVDWEVPKIFRDRCVASPVCAGELVIGTYGHGRKGDLLVAVRPGSKVAGREPKIVYRITKSVPLVPTPLVKNGRAFLWNGDGTVTCIDAAAGKVIWRQRVEGSFYGSPVWVAGRLYCISKAGEVVVLAAGDEFKPLARMALGESSYATPAVAGGTMFLRTLTHLISVGGR